MTELAQRPDLTFVFADEPIYVGPVAGGKKEHSIGPLHHSTSVSTEHHGDHWFTRLADGQCLRFECAAPALDKPMCYDCCEVLTWRLFDGFPQVVNLIGSLFVAGDIDYGDQILYREAANSTNPKARSYYYGGRSKPMSNHAAVSPASPFKSPATSFIGRCTSVKWHWDINAAGPDGYVLTIDGKSVTFTNDQAVGLEFYLPRAIANSHDHIDVDLTIAYKASGEIINIKERNMDQPAEKTTGTTELNEGIGHWAASKDVHNAFVIEARKSLMDMGAHKALGKPGITGTQIAEWAGSTTGKIDGSPFANRTLAMQAVLAAGKAIVDAQEKPANNWSETKDGIQTFWGAVNADAKNYADAPADKEIFDATVHEPLGVKHLREFDGTLQEAIDKVRAHFADLFTLTNDPKAKADEAYRYILTDAEFYGLRPEFKGVKEPEQQKEAAALILGVIEDAYETKFPKMTDAIAHAGYDGVIKGWTEQKHTLKPAAPKSSNGTHPPSDVQDKPAQPPATEAKPKPKQPPVQRKPVIDLFADGDPFIDATDDTPYLRMALVGPAGSGKTFTALKVATNLVPKGKIALLDSERGSAAKYRNDFTFKVLKLEQYNPEYYIAAIKAAERNGYDVLIIDSLSHAWEGQGGILDMHDSEVKRQRTNGNRENSFTAWREVTPLHNELVDAMLNAKLHIIVTLRAKTEYVQNGGKVEKVGMAPIQRPGLEYEFDIVADLNLNNDFMVSKTRCSALNRGVFNQAGRDVADKIRVWLSLDAVAA